MEIHTTSIKFQSAKIQDASNFLLWRCYDFFIVHIEYSPRKRPMPVFHEALLKMVKLTEFL